MVTGATSGMGLETAKALAEEGAGVILVGRNLGKCLRTKELITKATKNGKIDFLLADLSSFSEIRNLASEFSQRYKKLHILVNNAGGVFISRKFSEDDIEMTFALNYLGHFLLTNLMLPFIKNSQPARIINVSSAEHLNIKKLDFNNLQGEKNYNAMEAYSRSKLCNILFTYELARRLKNSKITVNTLHPGWVATSIGKNNGILGKIVMPIIQITAISACEGAKTCVHLATNQKIADVSGKYFDEGQISQSSDISYDSKIAQKLWKVSKKLIVA